MDASKGAKILNSDSIDASKGAAILDSETISPN
jgi:hypothetical protein